MSLSENAGKEKTHKPIRAVPFHTALRETRRSGPQDSGSAALDYTQKEKKEPRQKRLFLFLLLSRVGVNKSDLLPLPPRQPLGTVSRSTI